MEKIVDYVKKHNKHPITKDDMRVQDIIPLKFERDEKNKIICPVSLKELTEKTKIGAIKKTGNVFRFEVIEKMNKKANYWKDLITSKSDIN